MSKLNKALYLRATEKVNQQVVGRGWSIKPSIKRLRPKSIYSALALHFNGHTKANKGHRWAKVSIATNNGISRACFIFWQALRTRELVCLYY